MKWKLLSVLTVLLITLMACQGNDNAQRGTDNPNIDPTTYRNTNDGNFNNDQDYMMQRDADRNQNGNLFGRDDNMNNQGNQQGTNNNGNSGYDIAEEAAEKITKEIEEIDNAYVITTENNAYVAANLDNNQRGNHAENRNQQGNRQDDELSENVKKEIGEIVRSVDGDIENVYVSTNPDFLDLVDNYANDLDNGRPVGGFFDQIGTMLDRLFPNNVGR